MIALPLAQSSEQAQNKYPIDLSKARLIRYTYQHCFFEGMECAIGAAVAQVLYTHKVSGSNPLSRTSKPLVDSIATNGLLFVFPAMDIT